jgi:bifunctional DNase/RNase
VSDVDEVSPDVAEPAPAAGDGVGLAEEELLPAAEVAGILVTAEPAGGETGEAAVAEPAGVTAILETAEPADADVAEPAGGETAEADEAEPGDGETAEATEDVGGDEALGFELPPAMSQMLFVDVVLVLPSTHPVVVLQEADFPYRELRIPIGGPEGIAIGYASRRVPTPRPLTHELMNQLMENFSLTLEVVTITGLRGGMFSAEMTVSGPGGQRTLDCRPSDGIALALRQQVRVPIMADPDVLDRAGGAAAGQN